MELDLTELNSGMHHFLTAEAGANFGHAASVCLESQGHAIKLEMIAEGHFAEQYSVTRFTVTDQMKRTWNDEEHTTEQGAYGIAILIASKKMHVKAIERSRKKTGIDYWLGDTSGFLFQNKIRLEVSGIRQGTDDQVQTRLKVKIEQSKKSDATRLPALIVIVEFNKPRVKTGLRVIK